MLARLTEVTRPVILLADHLAGHRLPVAWPERMAWLQGSLRGGSYDAIAFEVPAAARAADGEAMAAAASEWAELAGAQGARWLLSADAETVRPAQAAGLAVITIGPRAGGSAASVVRPDYEARDLRDAVNHLLLDDAFAG